MFLSIRTLHFATAFFFGFILWIIVISDAGMPNIFIDSIRSIPYGDKLGHMVLYGVLAGLVNLSVDGQDKRHLGLPVGCALVLLFALLEELSQGFFPATRTLDVGDVVADFLGIYFFTWMMRRNKGLQEY